MNVIKYNNIMRNKVFYTVAVCIFEYLINLVINNIIDLWFVNPDKSITIWTRMLAVLKVIHA